MLDHLRETDRLEFFSDGVFAIAATLLAFNLKVPASETSQATSLLEALGHQWPSYLAFVISFLFIGIAWAAHHDMFHYIQRTTHLLLIINLLFLMTIALQPFSTALVAAHLGKPAERTAVLIYYGVLLMNSFSYNAIWQYAVKWRLIAQTDERLLRALGKEHAVAPILHATALIIAFWSVPLSFIPVLMHYGFFALPRVTERFHLKKLAQGTHRRRN